MSRNDVQSAITKPSDESLFVGDVGAAGCDRGFFGLVLKSLSTCFLKNLALFFLPLWALLQCGNVDEVLRGVQSSQDEVSAQLSANVSGG